MKHSLLLLVLISLFSCQSSLNENTWTEDPSPAGHDHSHGHHDASDFDAELAAQLGADDYGMKQYVMAFLKRGPNRKRSQAESDSLQAAHMENIGRLAEEGKLVLAGPFLGDGEYRGIYVFDVKTVEEARELTATDPAIQAGSLVMELEPWYGSAALLEVNGIHDKVCKVKF